MSWIDSLSFLFLVDTNIKQNKSTTSIRIFVKSIVKLCSSILFFLRVKLCHFWWKLSTIGNVRMLLIEIFLEALDLLSTPVNLLEGFPLLGGPAATAATAASSLPVTSTT